MSLDRTDYVYYNGKHKPLRFGFVKTSNTELKEVAKAWVLVSLAFAIVMAGFSFTMDFATSLVLSAFTVGVGFLLHELAHKLVAQSYGAFAEFRAFDHMLLLALAMSFFGFVFAAPGAVFIHGYLTNKKNGIISLAGPLTNLSLAILFLVTGLFFPFWPMFFSYGFTINAWLALFNMIPFFNFDGAKIFVWNKTAYFLLLFGAAFLVFIGFMA